MRTALRIDALIRQPQPFHRSSVDQVLLHNLRGILGLHVPVPDGLRVNHYRRAVFALIETAGLVDSHRIPKARGLRNLLQLRVQFALSIARARWSRSTFRTGVMADKDVMFENRQNRTSYSRLQVRLPSPYQRRTFHISPLLT
jgi:hypothetical protein